MSDLITRLGWMDDSIHRDLFFEARDALEAKDKRIAELEAAYDSMKQQHDNLWIEDNESQIKIEAQRVALEAKDKRIAELEAGYKKRATECERLWNNNERLRAVLEAAPPMTENATPCLKEYRQWYQQYCEALKDG